MNIARHRIRKQGSFTLVELMAALVILAAILGMRNSKKACIDEVFDLAGVPRDDPHGVQDFRFLYSSSDGSDKIHESWAQSYNYVVIDGTRYMLKPDGTWSTKRESSPRP